jgi:hypothetical protein
MSPYLCFYLWAYSQSQWFWNTLSRIILNAVNSTSVPILSTVMSLPVYQLPSLNNQLYPLSATHSMCWQCCYDWICYVRYCCIYLRVNQFWCGADIRVCCLNMICSVYRYIWINTVLYVRMPGTCHSISILVLQVSSGNVQSKTCKTLKK